jgi:hypothetical protein
MGRPLDEITFTATRRQGLWNGSWVFSNLTDYTFKGSRPQPVGPEEIEFLPEGARTAARYITYVQDDQPEIYLVGRDREGYAADTVAYRSKNYLMAAADDWSLMPLGYVGVILLEYGPDEDVPTVP